MLALEGIKVLDLCRNPPGMFCTMVLGVWQGIYLWEHRHRRDAREVVVNVLGSR